jgi:DNA polymerase-3 subunit epsilon
MRCLRAVLATSADATDSATAHPTPPIINPFARKGASVTIASNNLVLSRPLCVIDLETTGTDTREDRIVEVAVLTVCPDHSVRSFVRRVNPGRPIPPAATAVHGIRDGDVADLPTFANLAPKLFSLLDGCDLAGFGIANFDLPLLVAEFARAGLTFPVAGRAVLDALALYRRREPRDLTAAVKFYLGGDRNGAHTAVADAGNALAVLNAQVSRYGLPQTPAGIHAAVVDVDVGGAFRRGPDGGVVFGFGKYRGRPLARVAAEDRSYLHWILRQPFLDDARSLVRAALVNRPPSPNSAAPAGSS